MDGGERFTKNLLLFPATNRGGKSRHGGSGQKEATRGFGGTRTLAVRSDGGIMRKLAAGKVNDF
jgi:hypothetical protein